jgi:hypothetical protein
MTAPTLIAIRAGIATRLETISGLNVTDYRPGQIQTPAAVVGVPPVDDYQLVMRRGAWELTPTILVFVSAAVDVWRADALSEYLDHTGTKSIAAAIAADKTLGGVVDSCHVRSSRVLGVDEVGAIGYYGGELELYIATGG